MKTFSKITTAAALVYFAASFTTQIHAAALQGQLQVRPLTPQETTDFLLPGVQTASGLNTIAIGQPAYLDVIINNAVPGSDNVTVTWSLTNTPVGSLAALTNSPLGTNVPPYKIADRHDQNGNPVYKVAGRIMIRPDVVGQYTIKATVTSATSGSTNLTQTITAGTYLGANTCALCHSGGLIASNTYTPWLGTLHSHAFTDAIDGKSTTHFIKNCISCHSVGFDANTNSANGGFDDVAAQTGWVFPTVFTNGNWAAMPAALKNVANVQCENCHGPGSQHAYSLGNTNFITVTTSSGDCAQCHDSLTHHVKTTEWNNSKHAATTRTPSGAGRQNCVRCHTAVGFAQFIDHAGSTNSYVTNTTFEAITCAACHDPHDASNPHQLRAANSYTLPEGTTVTNVGLGALCMTCHHSRNGSASNNIANYKLGLPTWANGSSFGVHDSTAGDMVEGVNAFTYGKIIPSGSHSATITNVCVGCHMQPVATTDPAFGKAGGHTFSMTYPVVNAGVTNIVDKVDVCVKCHGPISGFDFARKDYDGDGVIQGVQTEVQNLLNQLSRLLPGSAYRADGNYVADGLVKTSMSTKTNWQTKFLQAAWNWQFVNVEGSKGVHNAPYAVGVLKASIADLTDDADNDGISDKWEILNFGSITSYNGNDDPDGDGVKNSLEISAGTNPLLADSDGDGVNDYAEMKAGSDPLNALDKPGFIVKIYTAAEIEFASEIGKKYQVQTVSDITTTWMNVGVVTNGTGNNISMVTSTRAGDGRGYFRVVQVP